jgi:long-chain acyl-CoA synthetase
MERHPTSGAAPQTFSSYWERVLVERSTEPALFSSEGNVLRTFQDVEAERAQWRSRLLDFSQGDCIIASLGNDPTWPAFFLACLDLKLVLAPIEPDLPSTHITSILEMTQAQGLVSSEQIDRFDRSPISWNGPRPDLLKITSGTTGTPRAVRTRESHLISDCLNICESMEIGIRDRNFGVIPFSHSYGFSNLITPLLYQGTNLVCSTDRMPRAIWRHLKESQATIFPGTPALFQALASLEDTNDLGSIRVCISAGAPMVPEILRLFHSRFGRKIHSFYGSSECGGIAYDRSNDPDRPSGFVGSMLNGVSLIKIRSDRIAVESESVADGYFPESDPALLDGNRFIPGDLVEWLEDLSSEGAAKEEYLRLVGRVSDFINVAGNKVHPSVVEESLRRYPGIVDAVVFGIPSRNRNEELVAYVVTNSSVTRQQIEAHCREKLSSWQVPREILILKEMPVNSRGKINRAELAKRHLAGPRSAFNV